MRHGVDVDGASGAAYTPGVTASPSGTGRKSADEHWREYLGNPEGAASMRRMMQRIPSTPRCKLCAAPFGKPGGLVLRYLGFGPSQANAAICRMCIRSVDQETGGAEVEVSILFADIRDSTTVAERISPAEFSRRLNAFYVAATKAVDAENGLIDKFVGDGVIALFIPGFVGHQHAAHAIAAARTLQSTVMDPASGLADLPIGIAVHTGVAFVGVVSGGPQQLDFTALGDPVNTASRLSSVAGPGELLVSADAADAAGWEPSSAERRTFELKGRTEPVDAWVVGADVAEGQGV